MTLIVSADAAVKPPVAKMIPARSTTFGKNRVDNYFWLRDRDNPETINYLEAENEYTKAAMKGTEALQSKLYSEILGRIQQTDLSVPTKRDDYLYYTRTEKGKQYAIYCRKHGPKGKEEVLLDGNKMAKGKKYFRVGNFIASPNHRLLAYSVDYEGDEAYTIHVKDLKTGKLLADTIPNTYYSLEWGNDNATFFYTVLDAAKRPYKVYRHTLGVKKNTLVCHETDERFTVELEKTRSRAYILINIGSSLTSEVRYIKADRPKGKFATLLPRVQETEYDVTHHIDSNRGDSWFIRTNDGAKTFRLVQVPVKDPSRANWKEVMPARPEATIESVTAFQDDLVTEERDRGLIKIRILNFSTGNAHYIDFAEPVYTVSLGANAEYDTKTLRFHYTSLVTPNSVFDYNMDTRTRVLKKQQAVLGSYKPAKYQSERIYATAPDGVKVPISLVYKKGMVKNGKAPMLLYGYGSYGISMDPAFSSDRLSLLDRRFIYAIAHIRGGADLGKPWHEDGRILKKKNTFTDFIACAENLVAKKYTSPKRLAIMGGSAGGLLMGAVTNMRPELFAVVVAKVPFVDALNTMLDASLPLTVGEYEEWGNPNKKRYYDYIKSYAPYENVGAKAYPAMLITAGLNDPRVSYWEPAKWTAKLRAMKTDGHVLLLKTNMGSGHFGSSGRYEYIKETAFDYAFILKALGVE